MNLISYKLSIRALMHNKVRTFLTTLGVIIGTAIVIIVLSVGAGIRSLILNQISTITQESLWVEIKVPSDKGTRAQQDQATAQAVSTGFQIKTMKLKDVEDVKKISNVDDAYALNFDQFRLTSGNNEKIAFAFVTQASYAPMEKTPMAQGRFFTDKEDKSLKNVIVLGSQIKQDLFGNADAVGQNIKLNRQNFRVVGVTEEIGTKFFIDMDNAVYLPVQTIQKKIRGIDFIQAFSVHMQNPKLIDSTISQIERTMRKNHNITDPGKDDFIVRTMDEAMDIVGTVTSGLSFLLLALASISLIVGGVGIMNTMYVSVSQRIKEIGLKKALGARPSVIRNQFLTEALIITMLGGIFGVIIGIFISWLVSFIANLLAFDWPLVIEPSSILLGLGVSALIGIIFGYAPAKKAAKLSPIDAIRS